MWFKKKNDVYEIDYDKDVAPVQLPERETPLPEILSEVLKRIENIEKKIDKILIKTPK
jgi:hypothetical protein